MKYDKPSLTVEDQVKLLISRGMQGDPDYMASRLKLVNYYRLSAYWRIYRNDLDHNDESFKQSTQFKDVWNLYVFDRKLRLIVTDAIERIEVAIRTRLAYHHSQQYGPFGYTDEANLCCSEGQRDELLNEITTAIKHMKKNNTPYIEHFLSTYHDTHEYPPIWITVEIISFGTLRNLFNYMPNQIRQDIAYDFGVADHILRSWLYSLIWVRNTCAHHARLWNARLPHKPLIPHKSRDRHWHNPAVIHNTNMFVILSICKYCLDIVSPSSKWEERVKQLVKSSEGVPLNQMGIPDNWYEHDIWSRRNYARFRKI